MVQPLDYWRLCTDFTIVQAALIICGHPPEDLQWEVERRSDSHCPQGYVAVRTALKNGIASGRIATSDIAFELDDEGNRTRYLDLHATTMSVQEIDRFLKASGMVCEFFDRTPALTDIENLETAKLPVKLAAAIKAWTAIQNEPGRLRGKSPKQALEDWLVENAGALGLLNRNGEPNRTGIEEVCKVGNWKPEGGATPTPTTSPKVDHSASALVRLPPLTDLDDEIPF